MKVRNRWTFEHEADVRYLQVTVNGKELESCSIVSAPGIKHGHDAYMAELESPLPDQWRKGSYRSLPMRMSCLDRRFASLITDADQSRGDISEAVESVGVSYAESEGVRLCRTQACITVPQRKPRIVLAHPEQALSKEIYGLRDAGQAWCVRTRRNDQRHRGAAWQTRTEVQFGFPVDLKSPA